MVAPKDIFVGVGGVVIVVQGGSIWNVREKNFTSFSLLNGIFFGVDEFH